MTHTTVFYAAKGGQGTTTAACAYAILRSKHCSVLLIDLAGDVPALLGMPEPTDSPFAQEVTENLYCFKGRPADDSDEWRAWDEIVIDNGTAKADIPGRHILVTQPCYLALRRAVTQVVKPHGIVVFTQPARALDYRDIERAIGASVLAVIQQDPAVARCIDAGLMVGRLPAALRDLSFLAVMESVE